MQRPDPVRLSPKDKEQAVRWLQSSAAGGNAGAQHLLGTFYVHGSLLPKSLTLAVQWFRKAAEQGFPPAQYGLGVAYQRGDGLPRDSVQAHLWFNLASAGGDADGKKALDSIEKLMTPEQKAEAMKMAREIFERIEANKKQMKRLVLGG